MVSLIKRLFGSKGTDFTRLIKDGATILDVRSNKEYSRGHIEGSINIPVDELSKNLHKFKDKSKPIITCCASGTRSSSAQHILKTFKFTNVHNGGGWQSLNQKIN